MRSKWEHLVSFEQSDEEHKHRSRNPESDETQKRGKKYLFFVFDSFLHFFQQTYTEKRSRYVMSNPVVFFDMEIGGQPAGRIEMTVRVLFLFFSFLSLSRVLFPSSRAAPRFSFLSPMMMMKILDHFFPIILNRRQKADDSFFVPFWRALTTSGGPLLLS